ncbi:NAD(P)-dependent dehydrogenase (short-subunit alcohol dehydrogenase family) [Neorhizobium galegae]|uniref:SDR family NAD(P)-dependent oxidoreductase n=1 Tax=Neorhizobium galegae TaxID=399 RepID=UPI0027884D09|nr:SDR family oxidoreductase [Neorhizobium galegae]MDQ0138096.1 NAD(P)-dependent dehydrogenase (short-subunit alcohol dehydrogenase family) [Neorhizobium galegae]
MKNQDQKTFLVTGGASGIGASLAKLIVEAGNRVIIADINLPGAQDVASGIGPGATALQLDICSEAQWEKVLDQVWSEFGGLDVLVNNAAIVHTGYARDVSMAKHEHTMNTNFFGPVKGMLAVLPRFKTQGHGHLATVCSMTGLLPFPGIASYAAAKHALRAFHIGLALEERHTPLKFTIVHPTSTETPMLEKEAEDDAMALSFAGTPVTPEFVAKVILDSIENNVMEAFAPPERGEVVKDLGFNPEKLWELMDRNAAIGAEKLAARRAAKAAANT